MIRWSAHLSMLFTDEEPLARPVAARAAGFACVESWWPPADPPSAWAHAVHEAGVEVAALNADGGDIAAGERGFCTMSEHAERTLAAVEDAVALASAVGAPAVNVLAGLLQSDRPVAAQRATAVDTLRVCGEIARSAGRIVVVEPLNATDVPGYLVPSAADAVALIEDVAHDAVRLLYDAYHAAMSGVDPVSEVGPLVPLIGHVQYADAPGRGAPGTGRVDLAAFVEALDAAGYRGAVGLEFRPAGATLSDLDVLAGLAPCVAFPAAHA